MPLQPGLLETCPSKAPDYLAPQDCWYSTVQYSTVQYSAVQYSGVQTTSPPRTADTELQSYNKTVFMPLFFFLSNFCCNIAIRILTYLCTPPRASRSSHTAKRYHRYCITKQSTSKFSSSELDRNYCSMFLILLVWSSKLKDIWSPQNKEG